MVLDDVYRPPRKPSSRSDRAPAPDLAQWEARMPAPMDRLAAGIADFAFFAPLATLGAAPFKRGALLAQLVSDHGSWAASAAGAVAAVALLAIAYHALFVALMGATPGQRLFGLAVVSTWTGERPRLGAALARAAAFALEACLLGVPWLAAFSNERRRSLHDRASDCALVVVGGGRRIVGPPSHAEAGATAGSFAAIMAIVAALGASASGELAKNLRESELEARDMEDRGLLCASAADLRSEWPEGARPSRLEAALALAAAGAVDSDCLYREADHEAWQNFGGRALAYAAKAIARSEDPTLAAQYADKACALDGKGGDACLLGRLAASAASPEPEASAGAAAEVELLNRAQDARHEAPLFIRAFAASRRMEMKDYRTALALFDEFPPRRTLAAFVGAARAKALWAMGRAPEARVVWSTSIAAAGRAEREELGRERCSAELEAGCAPDARRACAAYSEDARADVETLADAGAAVAFVRAGECAEGSRWDAKRARAAMPTAEGRAYVDAVARARSGSGGAKALRELARNSEQDTAIYFDAQARLAQMASTSVEADRIREEWERGAPSEAWRMAGRSLMHRFLELGAPRKALAMGLALREADALDAEIGKSLVVAAYKAGEAKVAAELLRAFDEAREPSAPFDARAPASAAPGSATADFDRIASELRAKKSARLGASKGPGKGPDAR